MNISDITVQGRSVAGHKTAFGTDSFLNIGKKGQTVEGTISKVSDRISINFNGIEIAVSGSAVQNATEGEVRKFRIMDVSKDNIVLKEVGNDAVYDSVRASMATTVNTGSYSFSDYLANSQSASEAKHQAVENLTVLTGEDYQEIEGEQGDLEKYKESVLDRAIERAKEKRQWNQDRMEDYRRFQEEFKENREKIQVRGFLEQKTPEQIAKALEEADLPASQTNISRITAALQMVQVVSELSDDAKAYIVENQLAPTIENLYHGQYSGGGGISAEMAEEETWQELLPQVTTILQENGFDMETGMEQAKWLFANDLPVTVQSLKTLQTLENIQGQLGDQQVMEQMLQAMSSGLAPEKASLDISQFVIAREVINDFYQITSQDVRMAVRFAQHRISPGTLPQEEVSPEGEVTLELLKQAATGEGVPSEAATEQQDYLLEQQVLTAQRQLEEIRLKMTLQAAVRMADKGINIEVTPLKQLVEQLRQMENEYYKELLPGTAEVGAEQTQLMQETLQKTREIELAPAGLLGASVRQQELLTVNELHKAAVSATVQMNQYRTDYEAVGTEVRKDLGDSIQKAFRNVPDLLREMGMEVTKANERAVRILGYNQMEVTEENVTLVKEQDARVNSIIHNMKPSVVLELIHRGENPLEVPLPELDDRLREIVKEQDVQEEEKYSRYLWKLEQEDGISPQEREGYIGIYRLLHQIAKSDGAVVGAVLDAQKSMTLGNLLTAARTMQKGGMDVAVDDSFGALSNLQYTASHITTQIENGFGGNPAEQGEQKSEQQNEPTSYQGQQEYYDRLLDRTLEIVAPSALHQISDGDMERLLRTSVDLLQEQLEEASGNPQLEQEMYQQLAEEIRKTVAEDEKAVQYLDKLKLPDTISNLQAAQRMLEQGYDVQKEVFRRRKVLDEQEEKDYTELVRDLPESLESQESIEESYTKLGEFMDQILQRSYEQEDISHHTLKDLKLLRQGILLHKQMVTRQSYDIPIETGDRVTNMNVTLIQGGADSGKVQISLPLPEEEDISPGRSEMGNISMELRISGNEIKGLILCDTRTGFESLSGEKKAFTAGLEEKGFQVKNLSYGMDYRSREDVAATGQEKQVPTARLYQAAKVMVQQTIRLIQETE